MPKNSSSIPNTCSARFLNCHIIYAFAQSGNYNDVPVNKQIGLYMNSIACLNARKCKIRQKLQQLCSLPGTVDARHRLVNHSTWYLYWVIQACSRTTPCSRTHSAASTGAVGTAYGAYNSRAPGVYCRVRHMRRPHLEVVSRSQF